MKTPAFALIAAATSALALPAAAFAAPQVALTSNGPVVELGVSESVDVAPDIATIGAGVTTEAPTATAALRQNSVEMQKVIARIKALGVAEVDIQTTGINLNARYDYDQETQRQVFRGYQASNRVSVTLRKIDEAGRVLDALVEAGANDLSGPAFGIDDDEPAKAEARKRAVARADAQARDYAAMLGYSGVRVLSISESVAGSGPVFEGAKLRAVAAEAAMPPPVQPGLVQAGISVTITYELVGPAASAGAR
jgi:hypothetical protein